MVSSAEKNFLLPRSIIAWLLAVFWKLIGGWGGEGIWLNFPVPEWHLADSLWCTVCRECTLCWRVGLRMRGWWGRFLDAPGGRGDLGTQLVILKTHNQQAPVFSLTLHPTFRGSRCFQRSSAPTVVRLDLAVFPVSPPRSPHPLYSPLLTASAWVQRLMVC